MHGEWQKQNNILVFCLLFVTLLVSWFCPEPLVKPPWTVRSRTLGEVLVSEASLSLLLVLLVKRLWTRSSVLLAFIHFLMMASSSLTFTRGIMNEIKKG